MADDVTQSMPGAAGAARSPQQLHAGEVLANRFTIVQFIARGGMGEVYEAADSYFQNRRFALKTLRPEIAGDPSVRARFEREVLLAREVRHDNVCPSYDLFQVESPRGAILFLTMKLLRGESLAARIQRAGPFDIHAALPLIRQMAGALDAAHRAGVIHRDFKPGNVMLEQAGNEMRVSVTDFGLSRWYESDDSIADIGSVSGTRGYIAPELLHGRIASPASDVYAFGVVVHEMLTGVRSSGALNRPDFERPSALVPGIPKAWDRMVMGCLEVDPARRFQSAGEALAALGPAGPIAPSVPVRPHPRRRAFAAGVLAAVLLAAAWMAWPWAYRLLHPLPAQRFVALMVWPADDNQQNRALLNSALDGISARLGRAAPRGSHPLVFLSPADFPGQALPKTPADAVSALGANLVLAAAIQNSTGEYAVELKVLDASTQARLRQAHFSLPAAALGQLPEKAAEVAAPLLDVALPQGHLTDAEELRRALPAAVQAFNSAEELMARPNDSELDPAIEQYQKAVDIDPRFALAYARLSMAYVRKFNRTQDGAVLALAGKNADQALHYNPDSAKAVLSRAIADIYSGQTDTGLEELDRAQKLDPDNPQILLNKALIYRFLNRRAEEESAYREIIRQRPNYWVAYNELGRVLHRHGNDKDAAEAFAEAAAVAPYAALPLANLGSIDLLAGKKSEAAEAFRQSLARAPNFTAYVQLGTLAFESADYRTALDYYQKAQGLRPLDDVTWRNIGDCYAMLGDQAKVQESYERAAENLSGSLKTNPLRGDYWMTLAFYQGKLGRRSEAESAIREAEARGASDVQSQFKKAQVLALLGRKDEAVRLTIECMDRGLSKVYVDLALDLTAVRADPRYRARIAADKAR